MTTKAIATATAQIALNKNAINMLHQAIHSFKIWREKANKDGDEVYVKLLNAAIKKNSRQIKQYVVVQKDAKKHLAQMIDDERCDSYFKRTKDIERGKVFAAIPIKADWMDSCGKECIRTALHDGVAVLIAENLRKYNDVRGMENV